MPRFHLDLHNVHINAEDTEGHELADLDAARERAIEGIRGFISHEAVSGKIDFRGSIAIRGEDGTILQRVPFIDAFEFHDENEAS